MPYCVICRARFYERSFSSDTEPCDCGNCISHRDWQDMDPAAFALLREEWAVQRRQEAEEAAHARAMESK